MLYGLGVTTGAGIYVLVGEATSRAGSSAPFAFALAALVMIFPIQRNHNIAGSGGGTRNPQHADYDSDEVGAVLLRNIRPEDWLQWQASLLLFTVMVWPNDEGKCKRYLNAWTATFGAVSESSPAMSGDAQLTLHR